MAGSKPQIAWTTHQDDVLRANASFGLKACQRELKRSCNVTRSLESIKHRGRRIGVSFARVRVCPGCGHVGPREEFANHVGLCNACNLERLIQQTKRRNEQKRREVAKSEFDAACKAKSREYARLRKEGSRIGVPELHG